MERKDHWEKVYQTKELAEVSWYEPLPETSLRLISELTPSRDAAVIDIGGGDSLLADHLLELGYTNITVLDISMAAIERAKVRLSTKAIQIKWIVSDMLLFSGDGEFDIWHDRATFHFLNEAQDKDIYLQMVNNHLKAEGYLVMSTFSLNGPEKCSSLPVQQYSEDSLNDFFNRYFKKIKCFIKDHETPFQTFQQFIVCVFRKNS